jgi:hypothetical protein
LIRWPDLLNNHATPAMWDGFAGLYSYALPSASVTASQRPAAGSVSTVFRRGRFAQSFLRCRDIRRKRSRYQTVSLGAGNKQGKPVIQVVEGSLPTSVFPVGRAMFNSGVPVGVISCTIQLLLALCWRCPPLAWQPFLRTSATVQLSRQIRPRDGASAISRWASQSD